MPVGGGVRRQLPGLQQRGLVQGRETCVYTRRRHKRNDDPVSEPKRVSIASAKCSSLSCGEVQVRVHKLLLHMPRGKVPTVYGPNAVQRLLPWELCFVWPKRVQTVLHGKIPRFFGPKHLQIMPARMDVGRGQHRVRLGVTAAA